MNDQVSEIKGGTILARLRTQKGFSQVDLKEKSGISRSMIAQLEIGERKPSRKMLAILSKALGISAEEERELLLAYDFSPSGETPDQIAAFLRADKNISEDEAHKIAEMVREAYDKAITNQNPNQSGK